MRRSLRLWAVALLVGLLAVGLSVTRAGFELEEDYGLTWLFKLRGPRPAPPEAVVAALDGGLIQRLAALPSAIDDWPEPLRGCGLRFGDLAQLPQERDLDLLPRGLYACLVDELARRGAAVIAFDINFRPHDRLADGVPALAGAIARHGRVILLEKTVLRVDGNARIVQEPDPLLSAAAAATAPFTMGGNGRYQTQFWAYKDTFGDLRAQLPARSLEVLALPALQRFADFLGRGAPPEASSVAALEHVLAVLGTDPGRVDRLLAEMDANVLSSTDRELLRAVVRVRSGGDVHYLNFYGPPGSFGYVTIADLLLPEASPPDLDLRGRVVFVGLMEMAIARALDSFVTVFDSPSGIRMSGVEIAATAFANMLHGTSLKALPEWQRLGLVGALGIAMTLSSCMGLIWRGMAATLAIAGAYTAVVVGAFILAGFWLPLIVPVLILLPLAIVVGQLVRYLGAARWLGIYMPRPVTQHLLRGEEFVSLRREVTILLTDIAGYTTLAERTSPEAVTDYLNRHFTLLNACIEAEGGVAAQFIGDSMMAFWGAPDPQPDHAARACRAGLAIHAALEADNVARIARGEPPVRLRIGINTGEANVGNVGAPGRIAYGLVGDTVNTTQRIEQLAKLVCPDFATTAILVSSRTRDQAGREFTFADAGSHAVRGRQTEVQVFRLLPGSGAQIIPYRRPDAGPRPARPDSPERREGGQR